MVFVILNAVKDLLLVGAQVNPRVSTLAEKIRSLPPDQIAEVEDFVEFARVRGQERGLPRKATVASSPVFESVWNDPEDAAYDGL